MVILINTLDELINKLKINFSNRYEIIKNYKGCDWKDYLHKINKNDNDKKQYYKIYINQNDIFELCLIFWFNDAVSPIHDHPDEGCLMKIIDGELIENTFKNISKNKSVFIETNILNKDSISNRVGNKILHQIINKSDLTVSLHVYFPPNFKQTIYTSDIIP